MLALERVSEGVASVASTRLCGAVSLSPGKPLPLPGVEQPGPELPALAQVAREPWPELPDRARRDEGEHVIGLCLTHELPGEVGAHVDVGIVEPVPEFLQGQVAVPQEVG